MHSIRKRCDAFRSSASAAGLPGPRSAPIEAAGGRIVGVIDCTGDADADANADDDEETFFLRRVRLFSLPPAPRGRHRPREAQGFRDGHPPGILRAGAAQGRPRQGEKSVFFFKRVVSCALSFLKTLSPSLPSFSRHTQKKT